MLKTIFSYNVNNLRSAMNKEFDGWLKETQPAMLCLQEIKNKPEQIVCSEHCPVTVTVNF